jgi:hypothetical protein
VEDGVTPTLASALHSPTVCRSLTENNSTTIIKPTKQDNILAQLRQYYQEVKTKRQLNFDVPAGFRRDTVLQKNIKEAIAAVSSPVENLGYFSTDPPILSDECLLSIESEASTPATQNVLQPAPLPNSSSSLLVPLIRCVDKPSSSLPSRITLNEDFIRASVGFRKIDTVKTHLSSLYHDTIKLDSSPSDAVLDRGDLSTIRKTSRNTTPVPRPLVFGDVIHMI